MNDDIVTTDDRKRARWWEQGDDKEAAKVAWGEATILRDKDAGRRRRDYLFMRMYENCDPKSTWGTSGDFVRLLPDGRLALNVIQRVIDMAVARVVVNRPAPVYQTVGGNASLRRKARLLERFVDGEFYRMDLRPEATMALTDAACFGRGALKVYKTPGPGGVGQAVTERTFPGEILVDPLDGLYRKPRTMYQVKFYPRDIDPCSLGAAPEDRKRILDLMANASSSTQWEDFGRDPTVDQVEVLESWRLPDPIWDGSDDDKEYEGDHVLALSNGVVYREPWKHRYFPITMVDWMPSLRGFWSKGLVERLVGIQIEINRLLVRIQQAMHLMAVPRIFCEQGSRIAVQQINNQIGAILNYVGQPPQFHTASSMHPEVFAHLVFLIKQAMEIAGTGDLNEPMAPGVRSGSGQRQVHYQKNLGLARPISHWDQLH